MKTVMKYKIIFAFISQFKLSRQFVQMRPIVSGI